MRDFFAHYALLVGILFFVGRLHVFPSLGDAFVAGLLATATAAIVLRVFDALTSPAQTPAPLGHSESAPAETSPHHDA
jgi:hypothetical protein